MIKNLQIVLKVKVTFVIVTGFELSLVCAKQPRRQEKIPPHPVQAHYNNLWTVMDHDEVTRHWHIVKMSIFRCICFLFSY